jgi:methenyltetrahydrofolate cyclohydrolase
VDTSERRFADLSLQAFTGDLAADAPVPGGGSASAVAAALGASLLSMVARLSTGRPRYAEQAGLLEAAAAVGDAARLRFLALADDDAAAYSALAAALKLPRGTSDEQASRGEAISVAARTAAEVPMAIVAECGRVMEMVERLVGRSNVNAASDLDVAALLLDAACRGAAANVTVNLPLVKDEAFEGVMLAELRSARTEVASAAARVHEQTQPG